MMTRREQGEALAYALGISIFLGSEGELTQHGPGEEIRPPSNAHVTPLGGDEVMRDAFKAAAAAEVSPS